MARVVLSLLLLAGLHLITGCGGPALPPAPPATLEIKCPAIAPTSPLCEAPCEVPGLEYSDTLEGTQRQVLALQELLEACDVKASCWQKRDGVWQAGWDGCGK